MKLIDIIPNDPLLEDLTRRGFLKGIGAAAGMAATGATASPFKHGEYKDQMTGERQGRYSKVKADNKNATLEILWPVSGQAMTIIDIPRATINFKIHGAIGRIKIGNDPVQDFDLSMGDSGNYSWGANLSADIARKILSHSGEVKIEVPIYRTGPEIFKFTIEQDNITKSIPYSKNSDIKTAQSADSSNTDDRSAPPSASYLNRVKARISPNIVGIPKGDVSVEIKTSSDGTIISGKLVKSSGDLDWDRAVLNAIDKTEVLPRDIDGRVPSTITLNVGQ